MKKKSIERLSLSLATALRDERAQKNAKALFGLDALAPKEASSIMGGAYRTGPCAVFTFDGRICLLGPADQSSQRAMDCYVNGLAWLAHQMTVDPAGQIEAPKLPQHLRQMISNSGISPLSFEGMCAVIGKIRINLTDGRLLSAEQSDLKEPPSRRSWKALRLDVSSAPRVSFTLKGISLRPRPPGSTLMTLPGKAVGEVISMPYDPDAIIERVVKQKDSVLLRIKSSSHPENA